jgi:hypothetical protein
MHFAFPDSPFFIACLVHERQEKELLPWLERAKASPYEEV